MKQNNHEKNIEENREQSHNLRKYTKYIPAVLALVIVSIIAFVAIRIHIWNIGEPYEVDPNLILETETEDIFFLEPPENRWLEEDDKKRTIVIFGNDTFADNDVENSISDIIAKETDAKVYNCCFNGSTLTASTPAWDEEMNHPMDAFCFYWLADSVKNSDFSRQTAALALLDDSVDSDMYQSQIKKLEGIDFTEVDLVIFAYDSTEYCLGADTYDVNEPYSITTMSGSLAGTFDKFALNYPNIQQMVVAPTFCYVIGEDGSKTPCDLADLGHGTLTNCLTHIRDFCFEYEVTYLDNYYGIAITEENADQYLMQDARTPNQVGRNMIAVRISNMINLYWAPAQTE